MKKRFIKIICILSLILSFFALYNVSNIVKADSGFDADYDYDYSYGNDSYYGGSSWDDDDDDDYYYGGSSSYNNYNGSGGGSLSGGELALVILLSLSPFIVWLIIYLISNKVKEYKSNPLIDTRGMPVDNDLNMQAYLLYKEVQEAWMNQDIESVRHLLTDEMFNMYLMQIDTLIEKKQVNVMKDIYFVSGHVASRRNYKGRETVTMIFRVMCRDYIVNENNKVIRGNKHAICDYTYELKLVRNSDPKKINCPSCGALINYKEGTKCSHCSSIVHIDTDHYRLANKTMLRQSRRK